MSTILSNVLFERCGLYCPKKSQVQVLMIDSQLNSNQPGTVFKKTDP